MSKMTHLAQSAYYPMFFVKQNDVDVKVRFSMPS